MNGTTSPAPDTLCPKWLPTFEDEPLPSRPFVKRWPRPIYSLFVEPELLGPVAAVPARSAGAAVAGSLSKCHNFHELEKREIDQVDRVLRGSVAKTARALRWNAQCLVDEAGLDSTGFMTFTPGDYICQSHGKKIPILKQRCPCCREKMQFFKIHDVTEANRRIKSFYGGVLDHVFSKSIIVKERHKDGGNHAHILGALVGCPDIRTGFDFLAVRNGNHSSVSPELKKIWKMLRKKAPLYGIGARVELLPIRKTSEAVASYISKYLEKHIGERLPEDRGRRLVRYHGFNRRHLKPNEFEWNGKKACAWRARSKAALRLISVPLIDLPVNPRPHVAAACAASGDIRPKCLDGSVAREVLGPRWAFMLQRLLEALHLAEGDKLEMDYVTQDLLSCELQRAAGRKWCHRVENPSTELCGETWLRRDFNEYFSTLPRSGADFLPAATVRPARGLDFRASGSKEAEHKFPHQRDEVT